MAEIQPDAVLTYDEGGITGNPDHIAVSKVTTLAFKDYEVHATSENPGEPRLFHWALPETVVTHIRESSGVEFVGTPDNAITTAIDVRDFLERQREAIACHRTQSVPFPEVLKRRLEGQNGREFFVQIGAPSPVTEIRSDLFV